MAVSIIHRNPGIIVQQLVQQISTATAIRPSHLDHIWLHSQQPLFQSCALYGPEECTPLLTICHLRHHLVFSASVLKHLAR